MRFILPAIVLMLLTSCTDQQIARAEAQVAEAERAIALAQAAVDQGEKLAAQLGNVQAEQIVTQAKAGLAAATAARDVAQAAVTGAKAAQAAGGSTADVLIAVVSTFCPLAGVALAALRKAGAATRGLRQTVAGVEQAKASLKPEQVDLLHTALAAAQDEHVRTAVSLIRAKL